MSVVGRLVLLLVVCTPVQAQSPARSLRGTSTAICQQTLPSTEPVHLRLERLLEHLFQENHALLREDLSRDQICLILESGDRPVASSDPEPGRIRLTLRLVEAVESDAELAFILSHELAHLWLRHPLFGGVPAPIQRVAAWQVKERQCQELHRHLRVQHWAAEEQSLQQLFQLSHLSKTQQRQKQVLVEARVHRQQANQRWLTCIQAQQLFADHLLGDAGAIHNWSEAEADAVGLDLFLNAGFDPAVLPDLFRRTKDIVPEDCPTHPERGQTSHPTPCWRLRHLQQRLKTPRAISAQRRAIARQNKLWRFLPLSPEPTRKGN